MYCPIGKGGYIIHCYVGYTYHFYVQLHITYMYMSYIYIYISLSIVFSPFTRLQSNSCIFFKVIAFKLLHLPQTLNTSGVVSRINHPIPWWSPRILSWSSKAKTGGRIHLKTPTWNWSHNFQMWAPVYALKSWKKKTLAGYGWRIFLCIEDVKMVVFWKWFIGVKWYNIICFDVCFLSLLLQHVATQTI